MPPVYHWTLFVSSQGTVISLLRLDISTIHWQRKRHMMLFPVLLSNLQRLSTAFEKKKITQNAVFISVLSDFNRARDVAKRPGDVCSVTTEAERRPRTFEPRQGSKTRKGYPFGYPFLVPLRARDGTRTRGPDLGKVVLHQLSHSRIFCCICKSLCLTDN